MTTNENKSIGLAHGIAGAGAGATAAFVTCPLDVVRTVLSVQKNTPKEKRYNGTRGALRTIFVEEGIAGYYKGLGTTLLALIPNWAVYFHAYSTFKSLAINRGYKEGPLLHMSTAISAATITDICVNPLWMVKTRIQTQSIHSPHSKKYKSTLQTMNTIVREEGIRALWKGLTPQLLGVVHVAIQFPLYEYMKSTFASKNSNPTNQLSLFELMLASSVSKVAASIIAYPHEVLRARFQYQHSSDPNRYRGIYDAIVHIYKEEGMKGFYRGLVPNLLRVTPSCAITFTCYEVLLRKIT